MDLNEARKQVQAPKKPKENFMVVKLAYDFSVVLPHKEGIALLVALANAEQLDDSYSSKKIIEPLERSRIVATPMSHQEYERRKVAQLLGITYADLEKAEAEEAQKTTETTIP